MTRAHARALVLVNWKGVFYERYLLDRHVTALEGANGAGKTTVMIAAYVVLLPDMSRLRFTNLGETGATGGDKGIYGRLGRPGPSYAAVDYVVPGHGKVIAGVHLERKGEPSVEPTPFVVTGLAEDVRLQDLFLVVQGEQQVVPELPELRESAARLGGHLELPDSAREYFARLFELGVTPLRLGTDEERNKLNEMLRTSMTGGISRALTSELRAFLLKEEAGLAGTLQRMRTNLDACRRTRTEVQESRKLEHEIGAIFEAGQAMFAAAFLATRERAEEMARRVADAEAASSAALGVLTAANAALERTRAELAGLEAQRGELEHALHAARSRHASMREALDASAALARCAAELEDAQAAATRAGAARDEACEERGRRREAWQRAQHAYTRAAQGLADLQRGLEELHRRAGAYHQVTRRRREAEALLGPPPRAPGAFAVQLATARAELEAADRERREASTQLADADELRRRHAVAMAALRAVVESEVPQAEAHDAALEALRCHRDRQALGTRVAVIAAELAGARALAERQGRARAQAEALGVAVDPGPAAVAVRRRLDEVEGERAGHEEGERADRSRIADLERERTDIEARRVELSAREPEWREHAARAARLAAHLGVPVTDRATLDAARASVAERLSEATAATDALRDAQDRLAREARELLAAGGPFPPELLRLKEQLGAELVAERFDHVGLDEAAELEARLGPLAQALVVDDPRSDARRLGARPDALREVLLVSRDADADALAPSAPGVETARGDVAVEDGFAVRVSRVPARPRLGRRASEARAAELRVEAEAKGRELEEVRARKRGIERLAADGEALLAGHATWLAVDPVPELATVRGRISELNARLPVLRGSADAHAEAALRLRPRVDGLRALLPEALLLDPPDQAARVRALDAEHRAAQAAREAAASAEPHARVLERELGVLRTPPISEEDVGRLRDTVEALRRDRERLDSGIEALEYVSANAEALQWEDAPRRLGEEQALVPALEGQRREAEAREAGTRDASGAADVACDEATAIFQDADGGRRVAVQAHEAASARFAACGIADPSQAALQDAAEEVGRVDRNLRGLHARRDELLTSVGRKENASKEAQARVAEADEKLATERREAEPAAKRWEDLRELAMRCHVVGGLLSDRGDLVDVRGHVNLVQEAKSRREVLIERLRGAQGGAALLAELDVVRDASEGAFGNAHLDLWLTVRDWLRRRLPAQIAEVDDPREALIRLRDRLAALEERLARQEDDLRGASADVAQGIEVQIRKARGQVTRLNRNLQGVSFGSVEALRVRVDPVERMEQVLRALREGAAQELLFQRDMPIEEALEEIFRRYGGGRTGGEKLLDYREYVHLQVEIRRKGGEDYEIANPSRLSTGEAIGVGAALMMVVLTEWERDATLLRGRRAHGSLRFLFLDEANRLSHDNLAVLFDLCRTLDLQLLIAAPEVAQAEGNTTYRLVRRVGPDGEEEVLVSGRRTRTEA